MKKLRVLSLGLAGVLVLAILSMALGSPVYAGRDRDHRGDGFRRPYHKYYKYHRPEPRKTIRIRFTDKDIDRLIMIGGFYFLTKAISEARKPEVVYVSPPPVYIPSPPPTYTPSVSTTVVTVRNVTNWYVVVNINGVELNLYPGYEQVVSWTYTGRGQYVEARAYLDRYHRQPVGSYQGNLVGYQIPWRLNFDYSSFG